MRTLCISRILRQILGAVTAITIVMLLTACHETIHQHPHVVTEPATLTIIIDNRAPEPGAVVDYTITPPVIIYSDNLPESVRPAGSANLASMPPERQAQIAAAESRSRSLVDHFDEIAPYKPQGEGWDILLVYEVYDVTADRIRDAKPIYTNRVIFEADSEMPRHDVDLELPLGAVTVVASAQYVPDDLTDDYFFITEQVYMITCDIEKRCNGDDKLYRDCFVGAKELNVDPERQRHYEMTLTRPQGRFFFIADDYEDYLSVAGVPLENAHSHIHYPAYVNVSYSIIDGIPTASGSDFGFENSLRAMTIEGEPYVELGHDWTFVNRDRSNLPIDVTVYHDDITHPTSHNPGVSVPVFNNVVTLCVGHWLTEKSEGGGGVGVDPDFDNEIVITF